MTCIDEDRDALSDVGTTMAITGLVAVKRSFLKRVVALYAVVVVVAIGDVMSTVGRKP